MQNGKLRFSQLLAESRQKGGELRLATGTNKLSHCPICFYSLQCLPANHRCPECGFDYGEGSRAWERVIKTKPWSFATLAQAALIPLLAYILYFSPSPAFIRLFVICLLSAGIVWVASIERQHSRIPRLIAVNQQGIWVRHFRERVYLFDWDVASRIRWDLVFNEKPGTLGGIYAIRGKPGIISWSIGQVAPSTQMRNEIRKTIESGLAQYREAKGGKATKARS